MIASKLRDGRWIYKISSSERPKPEDTSTWVAISRLKPRTLHLEREIVAMDKAGRPSFQILRASHRLPDGWRLGFYAFGHWG